MCYNHGKLVDNDEERYTVGDLRSMKAEAESEAIKALESAGRHLVLTDLDSSQLEPDVHGFAVRVRFDGERTMRIISDPISDPARPTVFAVANGLILTNTSSGNVAAVLELIVPQPDGHDEIIGAEIADLPKGLLLPEERDGNYQFRRLVNIPARSAVIGYAGFNLTERFIGPGRLKVPEMWRDPREVQKLVDEVVQQGWRFGGRCIVRGRDVATNRQRARWLVQRHCPGWHDHAKLAQRRHPQEHRSTRRYSKAHRSHSVAKPTSCRGRRLTRIRAE